MTLVAVPFQVYALTGSSLLVGVTSIVALVPLIVFGLLGGAIADAMDRRRLMLITSVGAAVTSALLAVQALLPGGGNLALLWVLTAFVSGFAAVNQPTRSAVIPALVGRPGVPAANALAMTVRQIGVIVGPLLAGVLIGLGELFLAYAVDALGFLVAALLLRGLPSLPPAGVIGPLRLRAAVRGVGEGFAFLRTQPVLLMTFVVDIIAMMFAWPQAVFPELSETRFADSPNSLGWLFAGISIGALVMGLTSGWVSRVDRQGAVVLGAIAVWGVAIIGFGLAPDALAGRPLPRGRRCRGHGQRRAAHLDAAAGRARRDARPHAGRLHRRRRRRPAAGRPARRGARQRRRGDRRDGVRRGVRRRGDGRRRARRARRSGSSAPHVGAARQRARPGSPAPESGEDRPGHRV